MTEGGAGGWGPTPLGEVRPVPEPLPPSPVRGGGPRFRGGTALSVLLPGLPQLLAGRRLGGGVALALWTSLVALAIWRWDRIVRAPGGGLDERIALAALLAALVGVWIWSLLDIRRGRGPLPPKRSATALAIRAFRRNAVAVAGVLVVAGLTLAAFLAPFLAPRGPLVQGDLVAGMLLGPSASHPLGTDQYARDVLSRILYGTRISLAIGLSAAAIAAAVGTLVGAVSGYVGGKLDAVVMRLVDMVISFPRLVLLVAIVAVLRPSFLLIVVVLGLTQWPRVARIVRGQVLSLREQDFIQAGRALGFSRRRIVLRHVVPNTVAPVIVAASLGVGDTIVLEAGLSFLGLGIQPPTPSWGTMVADGRNFLADAWWISTFSGLAIVLTVLAFNLAGDGLRDAFDPRLRG